MDRYWRRELKGATMRKERQEIRHLADREEYEKFKKKEAYLDGLNQMPDYKEVVYDSKFRKFVPTIRVEWMERAEADIEQYERIFDKAANTKWIQFVLWSACVWAAVGLLYWLSSFYLLFYAGIAVVLLAQLVFIGRACRAVNDIRNRQNEKVKGLMEYYKRKQKEEKERAQKEIHEYEEERTKHVEFVENILSGEPTVVKAKAEKVLFDYVHTLLLDIRLEIGIYANAPSVRFFVPIRRSIIPDKLALLDDKKELQFKMKNFKAISEQYKNVWLSCVLRAAVVLFENIPTFENIACSVLVEESMGYRRIWTHLFTREQIKTYCTFSNTRQVWVALNEGGNDAEEDIINEEDEVQEIMPEAWNDCEKSDIKWVTIVK